MELTIENRAGITPVLIVQSVMIFKAVSVCLKPVRHARKTKTIEKHVTRSAAARHASQVSTSHENLSRKMGSVRI